MAEKLSPWCKKAKIAMIQKDIGVSDMAERLGNNRSYISSVLNGRVVWDNRIYKTCAVEQFAASDYK